MRRWGARFAPPPPFDPLVEFESGSANATAINSLIASIPAGGTVELPEQIFANEAVSFSRLQNVVCPASGTKIRGSLAVRKRRLLVTDPGWTQINPSVVASVQVIDLQANGITSWGTFAPFENDASQFGTSDWFGGVNQISLGLPSLTCDDRQMELTRWPYPTAVDQPWTFNYTASVSGNVSFECSDIPAWSSNNWIDGNYLAVTVYAGNGNAYQDYYTSATISGTTVTLTNSIPSTTYGTFTDDCRFAVQNVLEGLLVPGQFYLDVANFLIYFIPPDGLPDHAYRVTWATDPLVELFADETTACSGSTFIGGPLLLSGARGNGMKIGSDSSPGSCPSELSFGVLQAFSIGADAFGLEIAPGTAVPANWSIAQLVVDWCGGCGLFLGPYAGAGEPIPIEGYPTLDQWNSTFNEVVLGRTCQWCRTGRGGAQLNCVGCTIKLFVSFQNPNYHILHTSHDLTVEKGFIDGSFTEGGDVGLIYSSQDPTIFGTVFQGVTFVNIPNMTDGMKGAFTARRALYIDNYGSGVTARDITCVQCNSLFGGSPDFCVFVHGGQACTIDGVQTISCAAQPVGVMGGLEGTAWEVDGVAYNRIVSANVADGRYQGKYGLPWVQLLSTDPPGLPINNSVLRVYPDVNSAGQPDLRASIFELDCPIYQPQGAVAPGTSPPFPPPLN